MPSKKTKLQENSWSPFSATFSDHVLTSLLEVGTTNECGEYSGRLNELGIEMGERPKRELMIMADNVNNPDDDYYEEFNIGNNE